MNQIKRECETWFQREYNFVMAEDWLIQCIEWLMEEVPNQSPVQYREMIFKQLIDFDLTEIGTKCLPDGLFSNETGSFQGRYLLQVCYCIDTSQSYYSQIQKVKGDINENALVNTDDNPFSQFEKKANRMLAIDLTDGSRTVKSMEFKPIKHLHAEILKPGTKVELSGRISYRQNVILLNSENIKVIGGHVDTLSEVESYVNILALKLEEKKCDTTQHERIQRFNSTDDKSVIKKQPTTQYQSQQKPSVQPYQSYKQQQQPPSMTSYNQQKPMSTLGEKSMNKYQNYEITKTEPLNNPQKFQQQQPKSSSHGLSTSIKLRTKNEMNDLGLLDDDDTLLRGDDVDDHEDDEYLALIEANNFTKASNNTVKKQPIQSYPNPVPPIANPRPVQDNYVLNRNVQAVKRQSSFSERLNQNSESSNKKPKSYHSNDIEDLDFEDDDFKLIKQLSQNKAKPIVINDDDNDDDDFFLMNNIMKIEQQVKVTKTPAVPSIKIDSLVDLSNKTPSCCTNNATLTCPHLIKGFIRTLTAPLRKVDMKWYQKCLISDGMAHLEVYIDDIIIADFMQLTCKQAKELFQKSREDSSLLKIYETKATECAQKLAHISGLIHLKYDKMKSEYCVVKFEDVNEKYYEYLSWKVKTSGRY